MVCTDICLRYKVIRPFGHGGHYGAGHKRCQICSIFMKYDGVTCPCCHYQLRTNPRSKKYKEQLRVLQGKKRIG